MFQSFIGLAASLRLMTPLCVRLLQVSNSARPNVAMLAPHVIALKQAPPPSM